VTGGRSLDVAREANYSPPSFRHTGGHDITPTTFDRSLLGRGALVLPMSSQLANVDYEAGEAHGFVAWEPRP
jgi:hypothetical protein